MDSHVGRHWHEIDDGRVQCDICPRFCRLREGQRGHCFVRANEGGAVVLTSYGRSSGFCVDPIEKKPLHHFLPGTPVLSFGTAGDVCAEPRAEFYRYMDAANVDLKAFTEEFYAKVTLAELAPVLETLVYLKHETDVWFEITTLLIPGLNDSDAELDAMTRWVAGELGPDVPMHFTAFHPDYKMRDWPPTPPATLARARRIALANGIRYAYSGNVHDEEGGSTYCHACGARLIGRDGYTLTAWNLAAAAEAGSNGQAGKDGHAWRCARCGTGCAGVFEARPGSWGSRRLPLRIAS